MKMRFRELWNKHIRWISLTVFSGRSEPQGTKKNDGFYIRWKTQILWQNCWESAILVGLDTSLKFESLARLLRTLTHPTAFWKPPFFSPSLSSSLKIVGRNIGGGRFWIHLHLGGTHRTTTSDSKIQLMTGVFPKIMQNHPCPSSFQESPLVLS